MAGQNWDCKQDGRMGWRGWKGEVGRSVALTSTEKYKEKKIGEC